VIPACPLTWPEGWKRTPPARRTRARFSKGERVYSSQPGGSSWTRHREVTIADGVRRVLAELERFGVVQGDAIISTDVRTRLDGPPYSNGREPDDPGAAVYWRRPEDREMRCMAIDRYDRVADNLAAIAATLDAMRAIERHGGAQILERAFTGFTALPSPETVTAPGWRSVLGIDPAAAVTRDMVEHRYKILRSAHHPDKGGSTEAFHAVTRAYEQACAEVGA